MYPDLNGRLIAGVGVDLISIERIKRSLEQYGDRFIQRVFSEEEIQYCQARVRSEQHFAARFAAKEAVLKVLGSGLGEGVRWKDVVVIREEDGPPVVNLSGNAAVIADKQQIERIHISLTHTSEMAVAFSVGEHRPVDSG